jgi:RHS repeat-associated protein
MIARNIPMPGSGATARSTRGALKLATLALALLGTIGAAPAANKKAAPARPASFAATAAATPLPSLQPAGSDSAVLRDLLAGVDARASVAEALAHTQKLPLRGVVTTKTSALGEFAAGVRRLQLALAAGHNAWSVAQRTAAHAKLVDALDALRARKALVDARVEQIDHIVAAPNLPNVARERWAAHRVALRAAVTRIDDAVQRARAALPRDDGTSLPPLGELDAVLADEARTSASPVYGAATLPVFRPRFAAHDPQTAPAIVPSYADPDNANVPVAADFAAGADAPFSPAILAQAAQLGHDYTRILDFVRSQVRTQWYAGAQKSVDTSLRTLAGNDVDQASLLIALLRASGTPARYVRGVVDVPLADLAAMLGVRADEVGLALGAAGVASRPLISAGHVSGFALDHVFVSAYLPFANYRGTAADLDERTWVPLMPALKPHAFMPAAGALARLSISADTFVQQYLSTPQVLAPFDLLQQQVSQGLAQLTPPQDYASQLAQLSVNAAPLELLPASTPYMVEVTTAEFAALPDALRQHAHVVVRTGAAADDAIVLDQTLPIAQLLDHRVTLAYEPASIDDGRITDANGGQGTTPPYLVHLRPLLNVAGMPAAAGTGELESGASHRVEITLDSPGGTASMTQVVTAGGIAAIAFDGQTDAPLPQADNSVLPGESETAAARLLANMGARYLDNWDQADDALARLVGVGVVRPLPSVALVINQYNVDRVGGVADSLNWEGVALDAALRPVEPFAQIASDSASSDWLQLAALQGSVLEHRLFEQQWSVDSISADKGLAYARANGIPVLTLTQATGVAGVNQPQNVLDAVSASLAAGYVVDIPRDPITYQHWSGAVWRARALASGESGYFISGALRGGATALPPEDWYFQDLAGLLGNAYGQDPDTDPLSGVVLSLDRNSQLQDGQAGTQLAKPLRALVVDAIGRPVVGAAVTFSVVQGPAKVIGRGNTATQVTVQTDRTGWASVDTLLDTKLGDVGQYRVVPNKTYPQWIGANNIDVSAANRSGTIIAGQPYVEFALPAPASKVNLLGSNIDLVPGMSYDSLAVDVTDAYDNSVANVDVNLSVSTHYATPICGAGSTNVDTFDATLFTPGQCPGSVVQLTGNSCATAALSTASRAGGAPFFVVPPKTGLATVTLVASAAGASTSVNIATSAYADPCYYSGIDAVTLWTYSPQYGFRPQLAPDYEVGLLRDHNILDAAAPGALMARSQQVDALTAHNVDGTHAGVDWKPVLGASFDPRLQNGSIDSYVEQGNGTYLQNLRAGADAGPVHGQIFLHFANHQAAVPGARRSTASQDSSAPDDLVFAWSLATHPPAIVPAAIPLTPFAATSVGFRVQDKSSPVDYIAAPEELQILQGDDVVLSVTSPLARIGNFFGDIARGVLIDTHKTYSARIVYNDGTPFRFETERAPITFGTGIIGGYGFIPKSAASGGVLNLALLVEGQFPKKIEINDFADVANGYACLASKQFDFLLEQDATVSLILYRIDANGNASPEPALTVLDSVAQAQGLQSVTIDSSQLSDGDYKYTLTATAGDGKTETFSGPASHHTERRDSLPLAHPFVKGVDLFSGGAVLSEEDIAIGGRGPGMKLTRTYASHQGDVRGWFGRGWSSDLDMQVRVDDCDARIVTGAAGQGQRFLPQPPVNGVTNFTPTRGYHSSLVQIGAEYDFYSKDGTRYHFGEPDASGPRISYIEDTNGNRVAFNYELNQGAPHITGIQDAAGRHIDIRYTQMIVTTQQQGFTFDDTFTVATSAQGPGNLQLRYDYDNNGNLIKVTRDDGTGGLRQQSYEYVDKGVVPSQAPDGKPTTYRFGWRLQTATNLLDGGARSYTYKQDWSALYDGVNTHYEPVQMIASVEEPDHGLTHFTYPEIRGITAVTATVNDANGHDTTYKLNRYGAAEEVDDAMGGTTNTIWDMDAHLEPLQITDALGTITTYTYDNAGNKSSETIQNGFGTIRRNWTYHAPSEFSPQYIRDRVAVATDGNRNDTTYGYDIHGNRTSTLRGGITENDAYDPNGDHSSHTDGASRIWKWHYDAFGYPSETDSPLNYSSFTTYDARGRKLDETDANGHKTIYTYDGRDRVLSVTHPVTEAGQGKDTSIYDDYADTRTDIDPRTNKTVSYFDKMGRLLVVLHADGFSRSLSYDRNGNLKQESDFSGNITGYLYDPLNRRFEIDAPERRVTNFTYDKLGHPLIETVRDDGGGGGSRTTEYRYEHPLYKRTLVSRKGGTVADADETTQYDDNGNPKLVTDPVGRPTTRHYDARDRMYEEDAPYRRTTKYTFYDDDRVHTQTVLNPGHDDQMTTYTYDADGRLVATADPVHDTRTIGYDKTRNVTSRSDARGYLTQYEYNARDELIKETGPEAGQVTSYTNDLAGNRVTEIWPNGNQRQSTYDERERRKQTSDSSGVVESFTYTADDQVKTRTDANGHVTTNMYDGLHRVTEQDLPGVAAGSRSLLKVYNVFGDLVSETDAGSHTTKYGYDGLGHRTSMTPPGTDKASGQINYTSDAVGRLRSQQDMRGNFTAFAYDDTAHTKTQTDPATADGAFIQTWTYDAVGNEIAHRDRRDIITATTYDAANRVAKLTRDNIATSTREYKQGLLDSDTDANNKTTKFTYDKAGRKLQEDRPGATRNWTYKPMGDVETATDADGRVTTYTYKPRRFLESESLAGETTFYDYDGEGHRTSMQRPMGATWTYAYDEGDRLTSVTDNAGNETTFEVDLDGNRTSQTDANHNKTGYGYDERHLRRSLQYPTITHGVGYQAPASASISWDYDDDDNLLTTTTANSNKLVRTVDALNRLSDEKVFAGPNGVGSGDIVETGYLHDGNGNITSITESLGSNQIRTATRRYDNFDRLVASSDVLGRPLTYEYDVVGNRLRVSSPSGDITHWGYNALNQNNSVTADNAATTIDNFASGRVHVVTRPDGSTTTTNYDPAGRVARIVHARGGVEIAHTAYSYDLNGNRLTQKESNGALTNGEETTTYTYDDSDWLTDIAVVDANQHPIRTTNYTLDAVGNRTREQIRDANHVLIGDSTLSYNEREQLYDRNDAVTHLHVTLAYDGDGNTIDENDGTERASFYDAHDRLVTMVPGTGPNGLTFDYDSSGLRLSKQVGGGNATLYQYDGQSLLAESNALGNPLAQYHYSATQLLSRTEAGAGPARHYLLDGLNTPIALLSNAGALSARTKYDAWGEIISQQAFDTNGNGGAVIAARTDDTYAELPSYDAQDVGFTGYIKDGETGFYYAKARYYDPRIARFVSEDPEEGKAMEPPSLHRYLYAYANPTVYIDPSGRVVTGEQLLRLRLMNEQDPVLANELREQIRIEDIRIGARATVANEEFRDTAVGLFQLGKNVVKASYETSLIGYASGAGSEGVDALSSSGGQLVNKFAHPIDNIYTPIREGYARAQALDAQGKTFEAEVARHKSTLEVANVLLTATGVAGFVKSGTRTLARALGKVGAADAAVIVEGASGDAALADTNLGAADAAPADTSAPKGLPPTIVFAGHGDIRNPFKGFRLGEDQHLTIPKPNHLLQEPSGQALERGGMPELRRQAEIDPRLQSDVDAMRHYGPGDWVPRDPTLLDPKEPGLPPIEPWPGSITVDQPTNLSVLMGDRPGCYIWAACTISVDK